jgi:hypothetical protein
MKQKIKVIPNAKENKVVGESILKVYLKAPPIEGKANKELIKILAKYFSVKKTNIRIVKGNKSKEKLVEII